MIDAAHFGLSETSPDNGPAISAAIEYAASIVGRARAREPITVVIPPGSYRVASTIRVRSLVTVEGYGARLVGPISGFPRVTRDTRVPDALDWEGQTAGAAFCDLASEAEMRVRSVVNQPHFRGLTLVDYRFGFVSRCFAWAHAKWEDVVFESVNLGIFAYQGAQHHQLRGVIAMGEAGTTYAAACTCFAEGHPSNGLDNTFCDGFEYDSGGVGRNASRRDDVFDSWFEAAVIRPDTPSVVQGGTWTFPFSGTALKVSGRNIYVPVRNKANTHSFTIHKADALNCPRGVVLVGNLRSCSIGNVAGEYVFMGTDGSESMLTILNNGAGYTPNGIIRNVDTTHATGAGRAVTVMSAPGCAPGRFEGVGLWGAVSGREHFAAIVQDVGDPKVHGGFGAERRGTTFLPRVGRSPRNIYDVGGDVRLMQPAPGDSARWVDESTGLSLDEHFWSMTVPEAPGGARVKAWLGIEAPNANMDSDSVSYNGTLEVWARRLDTGEVDHGLYFVTIPQYRAVTHPGVLSSGVDAGDRVFTVSGRPSGFSAGQRVKVGSDFYVLAEAGPDGVFVLATPFRGDYPAGTVVSAEAAVTAVGGAGARLVSVSAASGRVEVRNTVTGAPPVQFAARFTVLGPPR